MDREQLHSAFISRFHCVDWGGVPQGASLSDILQMETQLNTSLPSSYHTFALAFGSAYTPSILDGIVDGNLDYPDLQNIGHPLQNIEDTLAYWSAGMPEHLIGFANDASGNLFCFPRDDSKPRPDDLPVRYFDHEFVDEEQVANSFDEWLNWYLSTLGDRRERTGDTD